MAEADPASTAQPLPLWGGRLVGGVVAIGAIVALLHWFGASVGCAFDTSYCAEGGPKVPWGGRAFSHDGRPLPGLRLDFTFESARQAHAAQPSVTTDSEGRFCFKWPSERIVGMVSAPAPASSTPLPADPRFSDPRVLDPRFVNPNEVQDRSPPYRATSATVVIFSPNLLLNAADEHVFVTHTRLLKGPSEVASSCPESSVQPPWNRIDDASTNWRSILIYLLGAGSLVFLVASKLNPPAPQQRKAAALVAAGELALVALVWSGAL